MFRSCFVSLLVILISFETVGQINSDCPDNIASDGFNILVQVVGTETITREFILYVPQNYDENQATPLVLNFHGFGGCISDYSSEIGESYAMNALADSENFIVAYPQAAYRPEKEDVYWEPGDNGIQDIYENDIYFVEQLIEGISQTHNIDLSKVYACGYSNGGMMTYSLACNRPEIFAAVGIMSGVMLSEECDGMQDIPVITFHGIDDQVLPYQGNVWYQSVQEVIAFWLDHNNISESSLISVDLNEGKVRRDEYSTQDASSCVTLYTVFEEWDKPGDHVWFSDQIEGITPNELLWSFFEGQCTQVSSVEQEALLLDLVNLSPNPIRNQLVVHSDFDNPQKFEILDGSGKNLVHGIIQANRTEIELSNLLPGQYFFRISGQSLRFIKVD